MSSLPFAPTPDPDDVTLVQQIQQYWNSGNQASAIELLRPKAAEGRTWAAALMAWLTMQQGYPAIDESITWAIKAAELGQPLQAIHTFNNVVGHVGSFPQLGERLSELLAIAAPWAGGIDPVGQGWNLVAQGQPALGLQMMSLSIPWPASEPQMAGLVTQIASRSRELDEILVAARESRATVDLNAGDARAAIEKARTDLETSAKQAGLLVTTVLSDATNSLFKADAARNAKESTGAWIAGLAVLGLAALVAVLPVGLHYLDMGPSYTAIEQIALHLASTAALGTFAGVLLARARSRDRAAQRAHDLSTAMGTMISYSNQISDPTEKERFMMMMGQVVLQAHLTTGSGQATKDVESVSGMLAIANLLKPAAATTTTSSQT